jgi:hypothetical protein
MPLIERHQTDPIKSLEIMEAEQCGQFDDFIGVWENFVPSYFCDQLIDLYNKIEHDYNALAVSRLNTDVKESVWDGSVQFERKNLGRKDKAILLQYADTGLTYETNRYLISCFQQYCIQYGQLQTIPMFNPDYKLQKTEKGGGYHIWHHENSDFETQHRQLTWMIYLNDVPDDAGGETEFLYQHRRIKPSKGTVVIWPAGLTHVHKGNTVLDGTKYILTGWYIQVP